MFGNICPSPTSQLVTPTNDTPVIVALMIAPDPRPAWLGPDATPKEEKALHATCMAVSFGLATKELCKSYNVPIGTQNPALQAFYLN